MITNEKCPWCNSEISREKFIQIESAIREQEKKKLLAAEATMRASFEEKQRQAVEKEKGALERKFKLEAQKVAQSLTSERDQALRKLQEAEAREATIRSQTLAEAERAKQKELAQQREILDRDRDKAILREQAESRRKHEALQKKMKEMERQLERKTANEIGEGAEVDLFDELHSYFTDDRIMRVPKGQAGADILHEIRHKGQVCGRIVYDSKNRQSWQNGYVTKLHQDQVEAKADHAILATTVFPSGKKELCVESEVIVINPARAVHLASLLRQAVVAMHIKGLGLKERTTKMSRLYEFINSESYGRLAREATTVAEQIAKVDVLEKKAHDDVWKKRGILVTRMSGILRDVDTEIAAIIEAPEAGLPIAIRATKATGIALAAASEDGTWPKH